MDITLTFIKRVEITFSRNGCELVLHKYLITDTRADCQIPLKDDSHLLYIV